MQSLDFDPQTFQIIGAAMEVHRQLHRGLLEAIYCDALAIEFGLTGIYRMDFVCFGQVVVEVKAVSALTPADEAQLLNYLAMSRLERDCWSTSVVSRSNTSAAFCNPCLIGV